MKVQSIRTRLTVWYALALALGLLVFALATWFSMRARLLSDQSLALAAQANSAADFVLHELYAHPANLPEELQEYAHALREGSLLQVKRNQRLIFASNPLFPYVPLEHSGVPVRQLWNGQPFLCLTVSVRIDSEPWSFSTATSLEEVERLLSQLKLLLALLLPSLLFAAALAGAWLSRHALQPVDALRAAAQAISLTNLSDRLPVPKTGDELERLAVTCNSLLSRLEEALLRLLHFTGEAAHELRTPVALIRTTAEVAARRDRPAEEYRNSLRSIASDSERLTMLLDDLLLLARVDSDPVTLPLSIVDVRHVVHDQCVAVIPLANSLGLSMEMAPTGEPILLALNEPAVRRMLLVLLENALRYSRLNTAVTVRVWASAEGTHVDILDTGPGIPAEAQTRIFDRFYRSPSARETYPEGTGIGLSLAAAIAQRHQAQISIAATSEAGSTFRITFPEAKPFLQ